MPRIVKSSPHPHYMCFSYSKTPFKVLKTIIPIKNYNHSFWEVYDKKCPEKKIAHKNILQKSLFFSVESTFFYSIIAIKLKKTISFNISVSDVLIFNISKIIRMI